MADELEALHREMLDISLDDEPTFSLSPPRRRPGEQLVNPWSPCWEQATPKQWKMADEQDSPGAVPQTSTLEGVDAMLWQTVQSTGFKAQRSYGGYDFDRMIDNILAGELTPPSGASPVAVSRPLSRASAHAGDVPARAVAGLAKWPKAVSGAGGGIGLDLDDLEDALAGMHILSPYSGDYSDMVLEDNEDF